MKRNHPIKTALLNASESLATTTHPQHTPTPWSLSGSDSYIMGRKNGGKVVVALVEMDESGSVSFDEMDANAAYIVRCVNSHAELVAALERIESETELDIDDEQEALTTLKRIRQQARAALAKAKGSM